MVTDIGRVLVAAPASSHTVIRTVMTAQDLREALGVRGETPASIEEFAKDGKLAIRIGQDLLDTDVRPFGRLADGDCFGVEFCAIASAAQDWNDVYVALANGDMPETGGFQPNREHYAIGQSVEFILHGRDSQYKATFDPEESEIDDEGSVRIDATFNAPFLPDGGSAVFSQFGELDGTVIAYSGMPFVEFSLLWHLGGGDDPIEEGYFKSMDIQVPKGMVLVQQQEGAYIGGWRPDKPGRGRGRVQIILPDKDDYYSVLGQSGKVLKFMLVREGLQQQALDFYFGRQSKYDAPLGSGHGITVGIGSNCIHPGVDGMPVQMFASNVPEADHDEPWMEAIISRGDDRVTDFLGLKRAGEPLGMAAQGELGIRHPNGTRYGAMTGGLGINHMPHTYEIVSASPFLYRYLWEQAMSWIDRQQGFLSLGGHPFSYYNWRLENPDARFNFNISPGARYDGPTALWPNNMEDPLGFRKAKRNGPEGSGGADEDEQDRTGAVDPQHFIRAMGALQRLAELFADKLAIRILEYYAAATRADLVEPKGKLHHPEHRGSRMTRAEGWTMHLNALDRCFNESDDALLWLGEVFDGLETSQQPSGLMLAWDHNKEVDYAESESGIPNLVVTQSYQEIIMAWGQWMGLAVIDGADTNRLATLRKHVGAILVNTRGANVAVPNYRLAVRRGNGPSLTWRHEIEALYVSAGTSEWHYPIALAMAGMLAHDDASRQLLAEVVRDYTWDAPVRDYIRKDSRRFENAEPLASDRWVHDVFGTTLSV